MVTQKILSYKKILKINMFFLILCLAINIVLFKSLPNKVALQVISSGELGNYIPKLFFIFFIPIVISLITFYNYIKTELRFSRSIVPVIIMFILDIFILITNLFF
ncbi:DUF1648 domain-containing protein [Clostridium sp.]|uniref:DUF1648 domain-containing protein n=1 Tax=Clostridium sp. TaxID=1506 RepID=UPI003C12FCCD